MNCELRTVNCPQATTAWELLVPRPLPVICWDWTKAIALPRKPEPWRRILRLDLPGVMGAMP
jgi:hypothetical protein